MLGTENKNKSVVNDDKKPKTKSKEVKTERRAKNNRAVLGKNDQQ